MPDIRTICAILASLSMHAGAVHALDSSEYRLRLDEDSAYRLRGIPAERNEKPTATLPPILSEKPYAEEIATAAAEAGLDPALVHAVIHVESAHRANAVSGKGALGLMQVMPETARRFGILDASEPIGNLRAGTRYLRVLLDLFDQRTELALAAYNAGEGAVIRHARNIPPYPETRRYVPAVLKKFNEWRRNPGHWKTDYAAGTRLDNSAPKSKSVYLAGREL